MPTTYRRRHNPDTISGKQGRTDAAFDLVRKCIAQIDDYLLGTFGSSGSLSASPGSGSSGDAYGLATRIQHTWRANGPYRVDTDVDGAWVAPTALQITSVRLWRGVAGSSSSTVLDLNINGTTAYTIQTQRPTIAYDDADLTVDCTLPSIIDIAAGDIVTVDTDQVEAGAPQNWTLTIEGA